MRRRYPAFALGALLLLGCSNARVPSPPVNGAIVNQARTLDTSADALSFVIQCDGPEGELALLGGLCGASAAELGADYTDAPSGIATWAGPSGGPLLLLYNRVDHRATPHIDESDELAYSAFVLLRGIGGSSLETESLWPQAEPVSSGSITTYQATFADCSGGWVGSGTLLWRSTTLRLAWSAGVAC